MAISKHPSIIKLELANSLIHGLGVMFAIIAMPLLMAVAYTNADSKLLFAVGVYGLSFLMVFSFSTLYHSFQQPLVKEVMKILDHVSIYFLIAGTYTPLVFCFYNNSNGMLMLKVLWILAGLGIFFKVFFVNRYKGFSITVYLLMGWMMIWAGKSFFAGMPASVSTLILSGNLLYSIGLVFYLWKHWSYHHAYWHTLVLAASICHYIAVLKGLQYIMK